MTKVIRKYLGVLAMLPFLIAPTISGAFEVPGFNGFAAGISITGASVHIDGESIDPEGTSVKGKSRESMGYPSVFGEARFNVANRLGLTIGLDFIPAKAEFVAESKEDTDLKATADGAATSGTSTVTGYLKNHTTLYIQPTVRITDMFSVYLSAGLTVARVEADAKLITSTNETKNDVIQGSRFGFGVMGQNDDGFFVKVEGNVVDLGSARFSTADSTRVIADTTAESVSVLFGKAF